MDIFLGKEQALYLQDRKITLAIGSTLSGKADVFFSTTNVDPGVEVNKIFQGPGEYEVQGVMIDGVRTGRDATSFHIIANGVGIGAIFLDRLEELTDDALEDLRPIHILVLWLKNGSTQDVVEVMSRFDANQLIPAQIPCDIESLEKELQLKAEESSKLRLSVKNYTDGVRFLTNLSVGN